MSERVRAGAGGASGRADLGSWIARAGSVWIDGYRIRRRCRPDYRGNLQILRLGALRGEGLVLSDAPSGKHFELTGALRFDTHSAKPPEGGFILHLGIVDQKRYVSLHLPIEKDVFEVWRCTPEGFACELRLDQSRLAVGEIARFSLSRRDAELSFALGDRDLLCSYPLRGLDGALGLSAKYCKLTLWLDGRGG